MEKLVSVAEMQSIEREANESGLSYSTMMENAGTRLAYFIHNTFGDSEQRSALALVGSGNNGGDALVALCKLMELGWHTNAYIVKSRPTEDHQLQRYVQSEGMSWASENDQERAELNKLLTSSSVLIDGVLGTGMRFPLPGEIANVLAFVKLYIAQRGGHIHVVAVDCPSGIDCDTGAIAPEAIPADVTFTMAAIKRGMLAFPSANLVGVIQVGSIGNLSNLVSWETISRGVLTDSDIQHFLPPRPRNAHKGTFGTALIIAGSGNYPGAALLAGMGAYRIGAGLIRIAVPELIFPPMISALKEATWIQLPHRSGWVSNTAIENVKAAIGGASALLVGPGFGLEKTTGEFVQELIKLELPKTVFDADGLKLLARITDWELILHDQVVLTPHPGEMAILTGLHTDEVQQNRLEIAEAYARRWRKVVVLKGAFTVIADPGGDTAVVPVASPALARAGTGDVLAGFIVGLLAQGMTPFRAACTGAYLHAMSGVAAEKYQGNTASVLAGDLIEMLPRVLAGYQNR